MKVDTNSAKHSATDLAVLCAATIDQINSAETEERFVELLDIKEWQSVVGKTELIRWAGVLDKMDEILERAATIKDHKMAIDTDMSIFPKVQIIVRFTGLLFENTSSRGIYASTDRLLDLLDCSCMHTVIEVLHLLQVISKRSHFLKNKLAKELQEKLVSKLMAISQSWHGRLRKFRMTDVLDQNLKVSDEALFPVVHKRNNEEIVITKPTEDEPLLFVVERAVGGFGNNSERSKCDQSTQVILTRLRAVLRFSSRQHRILVLMARLIATSTLIYSRLLTEEHQLRCLISSEFIEECADLLKVNIPSEPIVDDLKSEALRTLTSIAAQEKQPRLQQVTEALGASSYHGFLSVLTRKCVEDLTQGRAAVSLCTSLFSLLYHMAGIDAGGEAIVSCGLMPTLLSVVSSHFLPIEHISFVTRCVRVIDIVTTVDAQGFIQSKGFDVCVDRLVYEINECRKEQPYTIDETLDTADDAHVNEFMSSSCRVPCHQQRSALIKSLLNFLKRAVQDSQFADSVRHIMEGELPSALKHIISNSEYYTAGLYHYAIMLVTNFIYQEPTQLTLLQNQHVPFVILQSLLRKEIPASRDVINNIPNTFTALCLNDRGLNQLKAYEPFDHVFRIVMSTKFITALKRRRNDINDLAIALGSTLDDLLRHHPLLRPCMVQSVLRVFDRIDEMSKIKEHKLVMSLSRSTKYASKNAAQVNRAQAQNEAAPSGVQSPRGEDESDDEDDGEPGEAGETSTAAQPHRMHEQTSATGSPNLGLSLDAKLSDGTRVVPLGEYMLIFAKIVETMVTQNASADVLDGLVKAGCVERLLDICQLPVIRIELAQSTLPNTVANIIKFLLQQGPGRNENLLSEVMRRLGDNLGKLVERAGPLPGRAGVLSQMGTVALTDLLATLNYTIAILGTLSKTAQSAQEDMRTRVLKAWTDPDGQNVLNHLNKVFRMICLESVVLHIVQQSTKTHSFAQTDLCLTRREDSPASASSGASTTESDNVAAAEGFDAPPTGQQLALHYTPGQGQHIEQPTDSVSTEAVAPRAPLWEITGVSPEERVFWSGNKETACLLTKLQKSLNDFLVHLSRACPKPPARATRRHYPIADIGFAPMNKFAKQLSENIFTHHKESLGSAKETAGILVNNYLTQVLEQLSVTLFDVRTPNFPLLSVFYRTGCHRQFCDMLIHTIAPQFKLNHTGETVRSLETLIIQWMQLAERLVSKPTQQQRTREQADFPVDKYHKLVQTDLFIAFNNLFSVLSGPGVDLQSNIASCEMTFNVYKDIVRNLVSLRDEVTSETSRRPSDAPNPADMVHPVHLQMLVDMGFARDDVVQALMECGTVAEATDYLISGGGAANDVEMQQPDRTPRQAAGTSPTSSSTDPVAQDQAPVAVAGPSEQVPTETTAEPPQPKKTVETVVPLTELVIDFDIEQTISRTCNEMIPLCMRLMDLGSDLVFSTSDLVIGVIDSCDPTWKKEQLVRKFMCLEIRELADVISKQPLARDKAHFLETRLHFACLLWEHIADEYLQALAETDLRQVLLNLLDILSNATGAVDFHLQDKGLLSPLLLWFDLYDKCSRMSRRRKVLLEIADKCELKWSFYQWEERFGARGRWSDHPADISSTITKAFLSGAPKVSFKMNKKEYTISFSDMTQKSDSGNGVDKNIVSADMSGIEWEKHGAEILDKEQEPIATKEEVEHLLNALVGLLKRTRMHHGVSHSVMLLLTRLTNDPEVAKSFYERDGISALLRLRCSSSPSTTGLLTLIIRNCIEDKSMVAQMMERSIRAVAGGTHNSRGNTPFQNRWNPARNTQMRDWKSSLYVLSPLIAKDAHMFVKTMNSIARLKDGKMTTIAHQHPTNQNNQDTQRANAVVELLLREVIEGDWSGDPNSLTAFSMRMVSRGMLLTLVAELLRGYGCVAGIVSELKYGSNSVVYTLLDSLVASTKDPETHTGLKTFIGTLASCNHATKAQDGLVNDVKSVISAIASDKATDVDVLITKVSELSNLVLMMRDACPSTHAHRPPGQEDHPNPTTPANTNYIVRLVQKRRLCGDLVWAVTQLPLNKKEAIDAVNNVLRTLDELTRNINSQVAAQNAAQNRTAQPTDAAGPSRSTDEAPRAELASDANITVQDVSFSAQPDTHHRVNYHNETVRDERDVDVFDREEDEEDGEGFVDDDDEDDQDDQDDDDGESDMDQSDREQDAAEHDEQDDGMANDDEGDELVEDSMSSGEEDNGGADDTMGEAVEDDVELIGNDRVAAIGNQLVDRDEVPVEVDVGDDSELTEDEEEDGGAFGRFFDEVDQQVGRQEFGLGRMAAADLLDAQNYLDEIYLDGHGHDVIQLHRQEGRAQATANNAAPQHHPLLVRQQPAEIRRQDGALGRHGLRYNILVDRAGRANGGAAHGLQRQGAVRARVIDNTSLFRDIFDLAHGAPRGLFELRPRPLLSVLERYNGVETSERRFVPVCSALERLADGAGMLEQHSLQMLAIVAQSWVSSVAQQRDEKEKEEAKKQTEADKSKKQPALSATGEPTESVELELDVTQEDLLPGEEPLAGQPVHQEEPMDTSEAATTASQEVPMEQAPTVDTTQADAPDVSPDVSTAMETEQRDTVVREENTQASESRQVDDVCTAVEQLSSHDSPVAENVTTAVESREGAPSEEGQGQTEAAPAADGMEPTQRATSPQQEQPAQAPAAAVDEHPGMIRVPDEYRDALGDTWIPEGVDPAFLAALPEDVRGEVLRDYERQQRAQRASTAPPVTQAQASGAAAPATTEGDAAAAPAAAPAALPGVEPLDQEFLAALPPELQEEILAQHERAVREAQAAAQAAANPAPQVPAPAGDDAVAVLESLPPSLRQQVLADADDSVLAALPPNVAEEARRLRSQFDREQALRVQHRLMIPTRRGFYARVGQGQAQGQAIGGHAGNAATAPNNAVQILDKDSIVTLVLLFLVDNPRLSFGRLQRVIRSLCSHAATCDFVIWCFLALLDKTTESSDDDDVVGGGSSWIDSLTVTASGNNEQALRVGKDGGNVTVHPLIGQTASRTLLDSLLTIAKAYPGHLLPEQLRNRATAASATEAPSLYTFWDLVRKHGQGKQAKDFNLSEIKFSSLDDCPLASLMSYLEKGVVRKNTPLQERLLKVGTCVVQTLPEDTVSKLGLSPATTPLSAQLRSLISLLTQATCSNDAITEGRAMVVEAMRALPASTSLIYSLLFESIEKLGLNLFPQIQELVQQLDALAPSAATTSTASTGPPAEPTLPRNRSQVNRWNGERVVLEGDSTGRVVAASVCEELRLPAVRALTDKSGVQHALLSSLQTITKIRDSTRQMKEQKRKKEEKEKADKEKKEEEERKKEAAKNKESGVDGEKKDEVAATASSTAGETSVEMQPSTSSATATDEVVEDALSTRLESLNELWDLVSLCLTRLGKASDPHAVLALQPAAEAFFLVHAVPTSTTGPVDHEKAQNAETSKLIHFAEQHRCVLNQVLRQNPVALSEGGPFAVLTQFPKLLDFDVKRKYFRKQLTQIEENRPFRREDVPIRVRRAHIFSESYRELFRLRPHEWKHRFYIMFDGEEGQDAGGLLREWYAVITREIFNPNYALFITSPGDRVTYMINKASYINPEHLDYFKFVGRIIAKAIYDNKLLDCYFTRAFYKHILNLPVRYQDLESEDPSFYNSLQFILENPINELGLDLTFTLEVEEFGVREQRELKPDGHNIAVTDENKEEYVKLVCQMKMTGSIRKQLDAFLCGFYEIIPKNLISMFNEQELELLISGLPDLDIDDLATNTEYRSYTKQSPQIQWFWRALRSFEQEDRAKFLQFVTGTSKVPLQGFASLEGMNGIQKFSIHMDSRSGDRLPTAHTCFNQLDLPQYDSYEKLRDTLLTAIRECTEGFGFA